MDLPIIYHEDYVAPLPPDQLPDGKVSDALPDAARGGGSR